MSTRFSLEHQHVGIVARLLRLLSVTVRVERGVSGATLLRCPCSTGPMTMMITESMTIPWMRLYGAGSNIWSVNVAGSPPLRLEANCLPVQTHLIPAAATAQVMKGARVRQSPRRRG